MNNFKRNDKNPILKNILLLNFLATLFLLPLYYHSSTHARIPAININPKCLIQELKILSFQDRSKKGDFKKAKKSIQLWIQNGYRDFKKRFKKSKGDSKYKDARPFKKKDLTVNFNTMSKSELKKLQEIGYQNANNIHYIKGAGGLWTRSGLSSVIKVLIPYNLKKILGNKKANEFIQLDIILNEKNFDKVIAAAKRIGLATDVSKEALRKMASLKVNRLLKIVNKNFKKRIGPVEVGFIKIAEMSKVSNSYIPFDLCTNRHTHNEVLKYVNYFRKNFKNKQFSSNAQRNQEINEALEYYFKLSDGFKDTHVFGFQREIKAMNSKTGDYLPDTMPIGIGAGNIPNDLIQSGYINKHNRDVFLFDNTEVSSNLPEMFGVHIKFKQDVTILLVPEKEGYVGGKAIWHKSAGDSKERIKLIEGDLLPKNVTDDKDLFNTGTIVFNKKVKLIDEISYETKIENGREVIRVKSTPGSLTLNNSTQVVGGRLSDNPRAPRDYEHIKTWTDYIMNGANYLKAFGLGKSKKPKKDWRD